MARMMMLAVALALAGCGQGSDGYQFDRKEFDRATPRITIVTHPTIEDLRAKAPAKARQSEDSDLFAWGMIRGDTCEIHVVDPLREWRPERLGHEAAHCAWGRWHK